MLHLQSLQLASLCAFPLAFVLCLVQLRKWGQHLVMSEQNNVKPASYLAAVGVMCYLIGQISNLTLEPLDLPP